MRAEQLVGNAILISALVAIVALEWRKRRQDGQAIVEFALVLPVMLFMILALIEIGAFGARWIRWQGLASQMAVASTSGALPSWWTDEAAAALCGAPAASLTPGDPLRVTLSCEYHGSAINGLVWRVTSEGIAVSPSPSPSPSSSVAP